MKIYILIFYFLLNSIIFCQIQPWIKANPNPILLGTHPHGYKFSIQSTITNLTSETINITSQNSWSTLQDHKMDPSAFTLEANGQQVVTITGTFDSTWAMEGWVNGYFLLYVNGEYIVRGISLTYEGWIGSTPTPILSVSPTNIELGTHQLYDQFTFSFNVKNTGGGTLSGNCGYIDLAVINISNGQFNLGPNESQNVTVKLSAYQKGENGGSITVTSNANGITVYYHYTVTDPSPPILGLNKHQIKLGEKSINQFFNGSFTISNTGGSTLSGTVSNNSSIISSIQPTTFSLSASQSKEIVFSGNSPNSYGPFESIIYINSNGGNDSVIIQGEVDDSVKNGVVLFNGFDYRFKAPLTSGVNYYKFIFSFVDSTSSRMPAGFVNNQREYVSSENALTLTSDLLNDFTPAKYYWQVFDNNNNPLTPKYVFLKVNLISPSTQSFQPVLLLHGWNSDGSIWEGDASWNGLKGELETLGYSPWILEYPNFGNIRQSAWALGIAIDTVLSRTRNSNVSIIAHSMGGLVARAYTVGLSRDLANNLTAYKNNIKYLAFLATPHWGARFVQSAALLKALGIININQYAFWQLGPYSQFIWELNGIQLNPDIEYLAVGGYDNRWSHYCASSGLPYTPALAPVIQGLDVSDVVVDLNSSLQGPSGFFNQFKVAYRNHSNILMNESDYPASQLVPILKDFLGTGTIVSDNMDVYKFAMLYGKSKNIGLIQPKLLKTNYDDINIIKGAEVWLYRENDPYPYLTQTDDIGDYRFNFVPKGNYKLKIIADGFLEDSTDIIIDDSNLQYEKNIILKNDPSFVGPKRYSATINDGQFITHTLSNPISLSVQDASYFMIDEDLQFSDNNWQSIVSNFTYTFIDTASGTKTVFLKFKDDQGNESTVINCSINYSSQVHNGSVNVVSDIEGAEVILNGQRTGIFTPATLSGLNYGNYSVSIKKSGFISYPMIKTITLKDYKIQNLNFKMTEIRPNPPDLLSADFSNDTLFIKLRTSSNQNLKRTTISYLDGQFSQSPDMGNIIYDEETNNDSLIFIQVKGSTISANYYISAFSISDSNKYSNPVNFILESNPNPWVRKSDLRSSRSYFSLASTNNEIYAVGNASDSVEVYDPILDKWQLKSIAPLDLGFGLAAVILNQKLYSIGGLGVGSGMYELDLTSGIWTQKSSMNYDRAFFGAVTVNDKIYAIGGQGTSANTIEKYDPITDQWIPENDLLQSVYGAGCTTFNSLIYIFGNNVSQVYDTENKNTEIKTPYPQSNYKGMITAVTIGEKIYVIFGSDVFEYDPLIDTWRARSKIPEVISNGAGTKIGDTIFYAGGIYNFNYSPSNDNYQPLSNIVVNTPSEGDIWKTDTNNIISWKSYNVSTMDIFYRIKNGEWILISNNVPANATFIEWVIPTLSNGTYEIKISDRQNPQVLVISHPFKIDELLTTNDWETLRIDSSNIRSIFYNKISEYLFAVTDSGVYRSSDKGKSWEKKSTGIEKFTWFFQYFTFIKSDSKGDLYLGTNTNNIYKSTNEGELWTKITHLSNERRYYDFYSDMKGTCYLSTIYNLLKYDENKDLWEIVPFSKPNNGQIHNFVTDSQGNLYFDLIQTPTDSGGIYKIDFNNNKYDLIFKNESWRHEISILIDKSDKIIYPDQNGIIDSKNYGYNWEIFSDLQLYLSYGYSRKMILLTNNECMLFSSSPESMMNVYRISEDGINYVEMNRGLSKYNWSNFSITEDNEGFIYFNQYDRIYKSTRTFNTISSNDLSTNIIINYSLFQNYPNPFNPITKIEFALPHESRVELMIFDILGQKVQTIVNDYLKSGKHQYEWNASRFASGVYFYNLRAGDFVETKKMILLK